MEIPFLDNYNLSQGDFLKKKLTRTDRQIGRPGSIY